ncbi:MAG: cell division topological specificity factor MinE [Lachnospiraceae bacterium]|jgi:cell division topological specificity factor|nr:cell division topological specificity factor MinE [Lachnospiraceae bacterium]
MFFRGKKSCHVAKDRLKILILSDRMGCSPDLLKMLKKDIISSVSRYISVDQEHVEFQVSQKPPVITAYLPLKEAAQRFHM